MSGKKKEEKITKVQFSCTMDLCQNQKITKQEQQQKIITIIFISSSRKVDYNSRDRL